MLPKRDIEDGDILGFSGGLFHNAVINIATYGIPAWSLSHVGIVSRANNGTNRVLLFEALYGPSDPCEIACVSREGTQAHTIESVLKLSTGRVYHYPYYRRLYDHESTRLSVFLTMTCGVPYDTIGAIRSAGVGLSWVEAILRRQDLTSLFCSEWVAAAYAYAGLCPMANVSRWNPNRLVRRLRSAGVLRKPWRIQ